MRFNAIFPLVFAVSVLWTCVTRGAEVTTAEAHFKSGVDAFQKKDLTKAKAAFTDALNMEPENPVLLFNLGMVEMREGRTGFALGLWRKALAHSPRYSPADRAVTWAKTKLERAEIPHEVESWETFRERVLIHFPIDAFLLVTSIFFLAAGWLLLRHLGARRSARLDEKPMPSFPILGTACAVLFGLFALTTLAKAVDSQTIRGTIVEKKVEARSSPEADATPLFELYEGLEVIVKQSTGDWAQVTYPGGATGWIPKRAVFATSDTVQPMKAES